MTDNEIIQTLECLFGCVDCIKCPYSSRYEFPLCQRQVAKDTLDLINRQQGEIIRLQSMNQAKLDTIHDLQVEIERLQKNPTIATTGFWNLLCGALIFTETLEEYNKFRRTFKSEAVKEFAARLKCGVPQETGVIRCSDIDDLVKEMVGDTE